MNGSSQVFPRASGLIEQGMTDGLHYGAQLYVALDGQVVGSEAFGEERPDHPLNPETMLCWMSSVKPVTAVAILQLCHVGELTLDTPVVEWIPEFAAGGKEAITIRHLLTHTAGFRSADLEWRIESWADTLERICAAPLESGWMPGQKAGYQTDASWHVLGEIVQRVTDQDFQTVIQERVFAKAGIERAWIGLPDNIIENEQHLIGRLFVLKQGDGTPHPVASTEAGWRHVRPAANGRGPIHELGRFYDDLLAGWLRDESKLLPQTIIRDATSRQREGLFDETFRHKMDWGLGFMTDNKRYGADTAPYGFGKHASDSAFGHSGNQSSVGMADPEHALVITLAFNGMPGEPRHQRRVRAIMTALYEDMELA